jgi:hypothetical protein
MGNPPFLFWPVTRGQGTLKGMAGRQAYSNLPVRKTNADPVNETCTIARAYAAKRSQTHNNRTGGQRRIRREAGERIPARAPDGTAPAPAIRYNVAFPFSKSPKRPQVRVMRTKQVFAKRRAAFFGYPIFASFLVTLVQKSRLIVIILKMIRDII